MLQKGLNCLYKRNDKWVSDILLRETCSLCMHLHGSCMYVVVLFGGAEIFTLFSVIIFPADCMLARAQTWAWTDSGARGDNPNEAEGWPEQCLHGSCWGGWQQVTMKGMRKVHGKAQNWDNIIDVGFDKAPY